MTEYGADAMPGTPHRRWLTVWSEEYQVALLDVYHRVFDRLDAVAGEQVWNFADFATDAVVHSGGREPKRRLHTRPAPEGRRLCAATAMARAGMRGPVELTEHECSEQLGLRRILTELSAPRPIPPRRSGGPMVVKGGATMAAIGTRRSDHAHVGGHRDPRRPRPAMTPNAIWSLKASTDGDAAPCDVGTTPRPTRMLGCRPCTRRLPSRPSPLDWRTARRRSPAAHERLGPPTYAKRGVPERGQMVEALSHRRAPSSKPPTTGPGTGRLTNTTGLDPRASRSTVESTAARAR